MWPGATVRGVRQRSWRLTLLLAETPRPAHFQPGLGASKHFGRRVTLIYIFAMSRDFLREWRGGLGSAIEAALEAFMSL